LRGYSKAAREAGKLHRGGVPNGYKGRKDDAQADREEAAARAAKIGRLLIASGEWLDPDKVQPGDPRAEELLGQEALLGALALAICPALGATDRLSAWRIWLDFTRAKPAQRTAASLAQADGYAELVLQMAGLTGKDGE
jgi:hypothetical protein